MKLRRVIDSTLYVMLVTLMGAMVLNVLWQVASRYIMRSPSSVTDELARFLLIWVGMLGASYVAGKKMHLAIDILPSKLTGRKARNLNIFINLMVALFAFFAMVWGGINMVYVTFVNEQTSATLNLPMGYVYSVVPLSGLLIIYYSFVNLTQKTEDPEDLGKDLLP